jgi:hypothetical protein
MCVKVLLQGFRVLKYRDPTELVDEIYVLLVDFTGKMEQIDTVGSERIGIRAIREFGSERIGIREFGSERIGIK